MKKFSKIKILKTENLLYFMSLLVFSITVFNANTTCMFVINQPKMPEKAKKLRKF